MRRERYIDIAKGWAILCIVFLHFEKGLLPQTVNVFIGSFMISMFYVTVGWIDAHRAKPMTIKELLSKRWRQLGIPYCWWSLIIIVFDLILWACGYYDSYMIQREIYKTFTLRGIGTLWFLPALFGGELLWYLLRRRWWFIALGLVITILYSEFYSSAIASRTDTLGRIIDAPFHTISNILSAWYAIGAGTLFYHLLKRLNFRQWRKWGILLLGVATCVVAYLSSNYLSSELWRFTAPLLGPLGFILLFLPWQDSPMWDYFDYWGRNSLVLMVTHYSLLMVVCEILNKYLLHNATMSGWIAIWLFIATMLVEYPLALFINKYLPFTLGKKACLPQSGIS